MRDRKRWLITAALCCVVVLGGCSSRPTVTSQAPPAAELSPRGSTLLTSVDASDSVIQLRIQRLAPRPSGESTVNVVWSLSSEGHTTPLFSADASPDLVFEAVTPDGSVLAIEGGKVQTIGGVKQSGGLYGEVTSELSFTLPRRAKWLRVVSHVGQTERSATMGHSAMIPVSSMPIVSELDHLLGSFME
jgi:hypothetical protein